MIFTECKPDHALIRCLTDFPRSEIIHEIKGKGGVCNQLARRNGCKGLIDEDPLSPQPPYVKRLRALGSEEDFPEHGLKLLRDRLNDNRLIVLCPRLEGWILGAAREARIDLRKYSLPNDESKLHRIINLRLGNFMKLLESLESIGSSRLMILKNLLEGSES